MANTQDQVTERFMAIIDALKNKGLIQSDSDFGPKVGYSISIISSIKKGVKVTDKLAVQMKKVFNVNVEYLKYGRGPMFVEDENKLYSRTIRIEALLQSLIYLVVEMKADADGISPLEVLRKVYENNRVILQRLTGRHPLSSADAPEAPVGENGNLTDLIDDEPLSPL